MGLHLRMLFTRQSTTAPWWVKGHIRWPPFWNFDTMSEIRLHQTMRIYSRNNRAKFHCDPIASDGTLCSEQQ